MKKRKKMSYHEEHYFEIEVQELDSIKELEKNIEYKCSKIKPKLHKEPHGFLYGVGFIFDEDSDLRVLVAIDKLRERAGYSYCLEDIIAVSEHEGVLEVYSKHPINLQEQLELCGDVWQVENYTPYMGRWVKVDKDFMISCTRHVLAAEKFFIE